MIHFTVPGKPFGKQRHRSTRSGHTYTPQDTIDYQERVRCALMLDPGKKGMFCASSPYSVVITAIFPIPKSWSKRKKASAHFCTTKPDCDNIAKSICDALNGIVWRDDSQVTVLEVTKRYGQTPCVKVSIYKHNRWHTHPEKQRFLMQE